MWLIFRCLCFGFCAFLMLQGLFDLIGIAKSIPSVGAILGGVISIPNWVIIERELIRWVIDTKLPDTIGIAVNIRRSLIEKENSR
jgi:hypothetical protein